MMSMARNEGKSKKNVRLLLGGVHFTVTIIPIPWDLSYSTLKEIIPPRIMQKIPNVKIRKRELDHLYPTH